MPRTTCSVSAGLPGCRRNVAAVTSLDPSVSHGSGSPTPHTHRRPSQATSSPARGAPARSAESPAGSGSDESHELGRRKPPPAPRSRDTPSAGSPSAEAEPRAADGPGRHPLRGPAERPDQGHLSAAASAFTAASPFAHRFLFLRGAALGAGPALSPCAAPPLPHVGSGGGRSGSG